MARRQFTVEEANRLIPYLETQFHELRTLQREAEQIEGALDGLVDQDRSNGHSHAAEIRSLEAQIEEIVDRSNQIIDEITETGCEIKDIERGLIDFPSQRDGRAILLCWKTGEEEIRYWHEVSAGFAGRQPL